MFHLQVKSAQLGLETAFLKILHLCITYSIISQLNTEATHQNATTDRRRVIGGVIFIESTALLRLVSRARGSSQTFTRYAMLTFAQNATELTLSLNAALGTFATCELTLDQNGFYSAPQCSHCKRCISYSNSVRPSARLPVCPSVCLSHAGITSKRLHVARCSLHCQIGKCV